MAASDKALLASAQQRAQDLLTGYIANIGTVFGKDYDIKWVYVDAEGNQGGISATGPDPEAAPEAAK